MVRIRRLVPAPCMNFAVTLMCSEHVARYVYKLFCLWILFCMSNMILQMASIGAGADAQPSPFRAVRTAGIVVF